jgi:hypothetical protein
MLVTLGSSWLRFSSSGPAERSWPQQIRSGFAVRVRALVLARTLGWFEAVHPVLGVWALAITVAVPG